MTWFALVGAVICAALLCLITVVQILYMAMLFLSGATSEMACAPGAQRPELKAISSVLLS